MSDNPSSDSRTQGRAVKTRKSRKWELHWTDEETTALLKFLIREFPRAGEGGTFKKATWIVAAALLETKFPDYEFLDVKDADECERRYALMRKQFEAVVGLKLNSGFTYTNRGGANISPKQSDEWDRYVESHPFAKPFRNRGFTHFALVAELTPDRPLGLFAFSPGAEPAWQPDFEDDESDSGGSDAPWPPGSVNPARFNLQPALSPSALGDHLSSIRDMTAALKEFVHMTVPPYNPLSDAIKILREHQELTSKQRVDISDFLASQKNDRQALVFVKLDKEDRAEWLQRKLSEIAGRRL